MHYYNTALALDPDYEQAILNKVGLFMFTGKNRRCQIIAEEIFKTQPEITQSAKELSIQLNSIDKWQRVNQFKRKKNS